MTNWMKGEHAAGWYAALAVLSLSLTGILLRYLLNYSVSPLCVALWRNIVLCVVLGVVLELFYPMLTEIKKEDLLYYVVFGFVLAVFNLSWTFSVLYNGAAIATVLVYLSALFSLVFGRLIFKENISVVKAVIAIFAIAGIVLIAGNPNADAERHRVIAVGCGVLSGFMYSLYSVGGRLRMSRACDPWTMLLYTFLFAALWLALALVAGKFFSPGENWSVFPSVSLSWWLALFLLAVGPTLFGFVFLNMALAGLPVSTVNIVLTVEPVLTIAWAYCLLGESLSRCQWCGSVLIILAVAWLSLMERSGLAETEKMVVEQYKGPSS